MAWQPLLVSLATASGGYVIGPVVLAAYLTLSLKLFGRHRDHVSSALRNPNYKNFLALAIEEDGRLVVHPVGIAPAASKRGVPMASTPSRLEPRNGTRPFLIEEPVVISAPPVNGSTEGSNARPLGPTSPFVPAS